VEPEAEAPLNSDWTPQKSKSPPTLANQRAFTKQCGRGERIRTSGLYVPNVALYQAKRPPPSVCIALEPLIRCSQRL
jgi:hypothetical protein